MYIAATLFTNLVLFYAIEQVNIKKSLYIFIELTMVNC